MSSKAIVKTTVESYSGNPLRPKRTHFSCPTKASVYISNLYSDGVGFTVSWSLWERGECVDDEYTDRADAIHDTRKMNDGTFFDDEDENTFDPSDNGNQGA